MTKSLFEEAQQLASRGYLTIAQREQTTDGDWMYLAFDPQLAGCMTQGETLDEALEHMKLTRVEFIMSLLEDDLPVPPPPNRHTESSTGANITTLRSVVNERNLRPVDQAISTENVELEILLPT